MRIEEKKAGVEHLALQQKISIKELRKNVKQCEWKNMRQNDNKLKDNENDKQ